MQIFIDLGAYDGDTIIAAKKLFPRFDRYIAFEPLPANVHALKKNLEGMRDVEIREEAATTKNGMVKLYVNADKKVENKSVGSTMDKRKANTGEELLEVRGIDFSEYLSKIEAEWITLKVDIEGEEYNLLKHIVDTGQIKKVKELYVEWHYPKIRDFDIRVHDELVGRLRALGFHIDGHPRRNEMAHDS